MKRALFVQVTEPGAYPPLINAAHLLRAGGWDVTFLGAPVMGNKLKVPVSPGIRVEEMPARSSHVVSKPDYLRYCARAFNLARRVRPDLVYASDPIGALPGLIAARAAASKLVYHEHDSPTDSQSLNPLVRHARKSALHRAVRIVFPNAERALAAHAQVEFDTAKLRVIWNVPRLDQLPTLGTRPRTPFLLYYHGSINPERLPETVLEAVASFAGAVRLHMAGYEAPGAPGYLDHLARKWNRSGHEVVRYLGESGQDALLELASRCHAGLVLMPMESADINMRHMVGASNKAFDYMAAGLPLLVSDLPAWREFFVQPGYGIAVDPRRSEGLREAIAWLVGNAQSARAMSDRGRRKIETEWNFDAMFQLDVTV